MSVHRADAPGRINLIGEHTDYNEGLVLPTATRLRTAVELVARDSGAVGVESAGFGRVMYRVGEERRAGDWGDYVRGVTWALRASGHQHAGFDAAITSDIPPGAGLASSAALEVALLRALREAFSLRLDDLALARTAHLAETEFVGARVGLMDQLAASLGAEEEALFIDIRSLATRRIALPPSLALIVIDSGVPHAHSGGAYNERRAACEEAARLLGLRTLRDATTADVERLAVMAPVLATRARHVVSENERVRVFVSALGRGDLARCGALLDASHASLRDDFEVSTPELDALAEILRARSGVFGARLVGGGFGGSVLAVASADRAAAAAHDASEEYRARTGRSGRVIVPR
jgi:galactokinase